MSSEIQRKVFLILTTFLNLFCLLLPAYGADNEDFQTLEMFFEDKDIVTAATGVPQDVSTVAENMTIVTAREIEAINAHTITDVLRIVPGVQIEIMGGPGSTADSFLNGANFNQYLVMIDGVRLNNLQDNAVNLGSIPVQNIKRIEIIKGPASSTWGPALGGVVNIVTKEPDGERNVGGQVYSSFGERGTGDWRGELSGTINRFGYYLTGGKLRSDGLVRHNGVDEDNFYAKLNWNIPDRGRVSFSFGYGDSLIQGGDFIFFGFQNLPLYNIRDRFSSILLDYNLNDSLEMEISGRYRSQGAELSLNRDLAIGLRSSADETYGTTAKLIWRESNNTMVGGIEYDHGTANNRYIDRSLAFSGRIDRWGLFVNDTFRLGPLSFTPGFRYDKTNIKGDFLSASIGTTWQFREHTLLRAYVGRGYSFPSITLNDPKEDVLSYQAGFESSYIPFFLVKGTFFHNLSTDAIIVADQSGSRDLIKEGFELELKTVPLFNTTMSAGYNYIDSREKQSGEEAPSVARQTWNIGITYDDRHSLRGTLTGHYIRWNSNPALNLFPGNSGTLLWDINLIKKIFSANNLSADLFFTGHNIFNGSQYRDAAFPNPRRWFEGGFRLSF